MFTPTMGSNNTRYVEELSSDESESDTLSLDSPEVTDDEEMMVHTITIDNSCLPKAVEESRDFSSIPPSYSETQLYLTVDAAVKTNLPKAEQCLNLDNILTLEKNELQLDEIISLVFLLFEHRYYALQEVLLRLHDVSKMVLHAWAEVEQSKSGNVWQKKFIEALCVIKNYKILKELGYNKQDVIADYLPQQANFAVHINKVYKALYLMCEHFTNEKTETFLELVRQDFAHKKKEFEECDPEYLELYLLQMEISKYITTTNVTNIKVIVKTMAEDNLCDMFDEILKETQTTRTNIETSSRISAISNEQFQTLSVGHEVFQWPNHSPNFSNNRKTSTSVDNNNRLLSTNYESTSVPCNLREDHTKFAQVDFELEKYPINPRNPGIVLIINQEDFYTEIKKEYQHLLPENKSRKLERRSGTEKDRDDLKNVFEKFGFEVCVEDNLNHIDMLDKIKEIANRVTDESSLFICILTHGDEGIVYGSNSCRVKVRKIESVISKTNKANLLKKPKVLILQSCQGQECQKINEDSSSSDEDDDLKEKALTTDGLGKQSLPRTADMLTFWATVPGYAAIRHKRMGSWFIQALCKKMETLGNRSHFADICTSVVHEVTSKIWSREEDDKNAMTPMVVHTLRYPLFLPPLRQ